MTDYSEYQPMKRTNVDFNNMNDTKKKGDHLYSDILGGSSNQREMKSPMKKNDNLVSTTSDWQTADIKQQIRKDYTHYSSKD